MKEIKNINKCFYCTLAPKCSRGRIFLQGDTPYFPAPASALEYIYNATQALLLYEAEKCYTEISPLFLPAVLHRVQKVCGGERGRKKLHARKKIYSKLLLLHFGSKNMVKENYCPNRILTNKLYLSIHCTMYISDAVITANCFLNIISIQRRGGGAFFTVRTP